MSRKQRLLSLALLIVFSVSASNLTALPPKLCFYECNIQHENSYCLYTGDCWVACRNITGGCISGASAECYDQCAM